MLNLIHLHQALSKSSVRANFSPWQTRVLVEFKAVLQVVKHFSICCLDQLLDHSPILLVFIVKVHVFLQVELTIVRTVKVLQFLQIKLVGDHVVF